MGDRLGSKFSELILYTSSTFPMSPNKISPESIALLSNPYTSSSKYDILSESKSRDPSNLNIIYIFKGFLNSCEAAAKKASAAFLAFYESDNLFLVLSPFFLAYASRKTVIDMAITLKDMLSNLVLDNSNIILSSSYTFIHYNASIISKLYNIG